MTTKAEKRTQERPLVVLRKGTELPEFLGTILDALIRDNPYSGKAQTFVGMCNGMYAQYRDQYTVEYITSTLAGEFVTIEWVEEDTKPSYGLRVAGMR